MKYYLFLILDSHNARFTGNFKRSYFVLLFERSECKK